MLLPVNIDNVVAGTVRPSVDTSTVLLSILPLSLKPLSTRVVQHSVPVALVIFELTLVELPIRPEELTLAILLSGTPLTLEHRAISPLEVPIAVHLIVRECSLEHFSLGCDATSQTMTLSLREVPLIDRPVWVDLDTFAIWLPGGVVDLTTVHGAAFPLVKPFHKGSLFIRDRSSSQVLQANSWH